MVIKQGLTQVLRVTLHHVLLANQLLMLLVTKHNFLVALKILKSKNRLLNGKMKLQTLRGAKKQRYMSLTMSCNSWKTKFPHLLINKSSHRLKSDAVKKTRWLSQCHRSSIATKKKYNAMMTLKFPLCHHFLLRIVSYCRFAAKTLPSVWTHKWCLSRRKIRGKHFKTEASIQAELLIAGALMPQALSQISKKQRWTVVQSLEMSSQCMSAGIHLVQILIKSRIRCAQPSTIRVFSNVKILGQHSSVIQILLLQAMPWKFKYSKS